MATTTTFVFSFCFGVDTSTEATEFGVRTVLHEGAATTTLGRNSMVTDPDVNFRDDNADWIPCNVDVGHILSPIVADTAVIISPTLMPAMERGD